MKTKILIIIGLVSAALYYWQSRPLLTEKNVEMVLENHKTMPADNSKQVFWKAKYIYDTTNYTPALSYAGALVETFNQTGNINSLLQAKNILLNTNQIYKNEAGLLRSLAHVSLSLHEFNEAYRYAKQASLLGDKKYESDLILFDAAFELGKITEAKLLLTKIKKAHEYAYYFRLSKMHHYNGDLDQATESLKKALLYADQNKDLQQAAYANLGTLYLNHGQFGKAKDNYLATLAIDAANVHAITGLAKIAALHDKNYDLARALIQKTAQLHLSPEAYYQLMHIATGQGNKAWAQQMAQQFVNEASKPAYGNMYNKYLVEIYSAVWPNSQKLMAVAQSEINNRNTATAHTWYSLALLQNKQHTAAMQHHKKHVAGQPLEANELYYSALLHKNNNNLQLAKKYAQQAMKTEAELSPVYIKSIKQWI
jgi:hypothetical protein